MNTRYTPGNWFAVVVGTRAVFLDRDIKPQVVDEVWRLLGAGGGVGEVLQLLTGAFETSLMAIPPFAVISIEDTSVHLAVRGQLAVTIDDEKSTQEVTGTGVATWSERLVVNPAVVTIHDAAMTGSGTSGLFLESAVVLADSLTMTLRELIPDPGESSSEAFAQPVPASGAAASQLADSKADRADAAPTVSAASETPRAQGMSDAEYDQMWGATQASVSDASDKDVTSSLSAGKRDPMIAQVPAFAGAAGKDTTTTDSYLESVVTPVLGDHDGETVLKGDLSSTASGSAPTLPLDPPAASSVTVLARPCMVGHANPPQAATCFLCGQPVVGDTAHLARPPLGQVTISTGTVIDLDRSLVIGRKPRASRIGDGEMPRLVTVPSPEQDISRSHLEVRIEDWSVLAADMGTTNGTTLLRPGQAPRRLHPNETVLIASGDVFDIGDGVTLTFENLP